MNMPIALSKIKTDLECMGFKIVKFQNGEECYYGNGIIYMNFKRDIEFIHIEYDTLNED